MEDQLAQPQAGAPLQPCAYGTLRRRTVFSANAGRSRHPGALFSLGTITLGVTPAQDGAALEFITLHTTSFLSLSITRRRCCGTESMVMILIAIATWVRRQ
jgi:hypothetical protein